MTAGERNYYHQRAPEYDDFYSGGGLYAARPRPGWNEELETLQHVVSSLPPGRILDVACGTGFLTRRLPGSVIAIDQSSAMLQIARTRLPNGHVVQGDALNLPFGPHAFDCLSAGHFYGHLRERERAHFLAEARRVARHALIIDAALREGLAPEQEQPRILNDGSRHTVYKRYFTPAQLVSELGGGIVLHVGRWFVAVLA
jgi:demethylmenaquinone methyltransferase/2-methoxy-6-polyprenyl-1,4-benzoquinol methylase